MEARSRARGVKGISAPKTKAARRTMAAPSAEKEPTGVDESAINGQKLVTPLAQNVSSSCPPPLEVTTGQTCPPVQTTLLLTYNNSKEEARVQKPSKAIVKVSTDGKKRLANLEAPRGIPCVGSFTVQCALCMKWRLIPTKEQYEEIRQSVLEKPFFCSSTVGWRPDASCEDPSDVLQDESHLWAIDRPNIPVAPHGWERQLVIRAAGASKFADVYYVTPSGRKLRSMPEVERFLAAFPDYAKAGVKQSQFSFIIPRPLDSNYCRKKTADPRSPSTNNSGNQKLSTNKIKKSRGNKLSVKRKEIESLSAKEGSDEQVNWKKPSVSATAAQNPENGSGEHASYDSLISQQVVKGSLHPEEHMQGLSGGFDVPNSGNRGPVRTVGKSQEHPSTLKKADVARQDLHSCENNPGESSSGQAIPRGKEQNASTEHSQVHSTPGTEPSSFQERSTALGS